MGKGADTEVKDTLGKAALEFARAQKHQTVVDFLTSPAAIQAARSKYRSDDQKMLDNKAALVHAARYYIQS